MNRIKQKKLLGTNISITGIIFLCLLPLCGQAQDDLERKYLALLINEITAMEAVLHKAEENRNKDARVAFQYEWFRADLLKMKTGIMAHINAPRTMPRKVAPLQGDYRQ